MKLLFVSPYLPYPLLTGSTLITFNHIKHLSLRHAVDVISFKDRKNPNSLGDLPLFCNNIELVDRPPRWQVLSHLLEGVARDPHPAFSFARSEKMSEAVDRRLAAETYDVVLFQLME